MKVDDLLTKCEKMRSGWLDINIDGETYDIDLIFVDSALENELRLKCKHVHIYRITRDPRPDESAYFVGEVLIKAAEIKAILAQGWHFPDGSLPEVGWIIDITGAANIQIVCLELTEQGS